MMRLVLKMMTMVMLVREGFGWIVGVRRYERIMTKKKTKKYMLEWR